MANLEKELSFEQIKNFFENSKYLMSLETVLITGGEPFLREDIVDICLLLLRLYPNIKITISSNGFATPIIINRVNSLLTSCDPSNLNISFSIDGIGDTHNKIRGVPQGFDSCLGTISDLKSKYPDLNIGLGFTITDKNYEELMDVYHLSQELNVGFTFRFAQNSINYYGNLEQTFIYGENTLSVIQDSIERIITSQINAANFFSVLRQSHILFFRSKMVDHQKNSKRDVRCLSGTESCYLNPYGEIYPCIMLNASLGNIAEMDFDELWLSSKAQHIRDSIEKRFCHCWTGCEIGKALDRSIKVKLWVSWNFFKYRIRKGQNGLWAQSK